MQVEKKCEKRIQSREEVRMEKERVEKECEKRRILSRERV